MYYQHFNLSGPPFQFTPSAGVLYPSKTHREALAALEWGSLHEPSGLTLLIGEPGTGKTTLISSILSRHLEHVRIAYIGNPKLSFDEILLVIARQLGITFNSSQRLEKLDALERFLEAHQRNERVTVIIDEAQVMPEDVVEELRLLSNWAPGRQAALRFVFVGQPEFLHRLESPGLRQLNERIGAPAMLNPLRYKEIQEYIDFRLQAGKGSAKNIFSAGALKHIADHSGGIPRRINVLCQNAMLLAYTADRKRVSTQHAKSAVAEYEDLFASNVAALRPETDVQARRSRLRWRTAASIAAVGAAGIGAAYFWALRTPHFTSYRVSSRRSVSAWKPQNAIPDPVRRVSNPAELMPRREPISAPADPAPEKPSATTPTGIAAGTSAPEPKAPEHRLRQIRVRIGDTIAEIARRYLGSREKVGALIAANPQLLSLV